MHSTGCLQHAQKLLLVPANDLLISARCQDVVPARQISVFKARMELLYLLGCIVPAGAVVCNPYGTFGQPQIWPHGFPLEHVKGVAECNSFARQLARPLILQVFA